MAAMRDVFWEQIYARAKKDRDIVVLSADFTAPSLDKFRLELPSQFIFTGISEQNTILTAVGMALRGKKVFCYAIAPFLTMRCYEQIRLYLAGGNLPITLVGVGAGMAYEDSGYTHQAYEDIALMRILPHMMVYIPSDNIAVKYMADLILESKSPAYLRLDRYGDDAVGVDRSYEAVKKGIQVLRPIQKINILACGNMVRRALEAEAILQEEGIPVGIADICRIPLEEQNFFEIFRYSERLVSLEEHTLSGGVGSYLLEKVSDLGMEVKVDRLALDLREGYYVKFGGRAQMHKDFRLDAESIAAAIKQRKI